MSIRDEIESYIDGNGLVAPNLVDPGSGAASDNGPMFTSEYYIILAKSGLLTEADKQRFNILISQCIDKNDMLNRFPINQPSRQEGPDDYLGVLNACKHLGITDIPRKFLFTTLIHLGFLNNENEELFSLRSFLIRQPQLLATMFSAAFPSLFNPLHILLRLLGFPFYLIAALVIALSCINTDPYDTDSRRLSWHLLQITKGTSLLCKLASLLWYHRLHNDYIDGMRSVATIYYHPQGQHPFSRYWID